MIAHALFAAVSSSPVTESNNAAAANVVLCSSISSPELNAGAKLEPEPASHPLHAASESSSDTGVSNHRV